MAEIHHGINIVVNSHSMKYFLNSDLEYLNIDSKLSQKRVKQIFGKPENTELFEFNNNYNNSKNKEHSKSFLYKNGKIRIVFYYSNKKCKGLNIYTKELIVDNISVFNLKKRQILKLINQHSKIDLETARIDSHIHAGIKFESFEFKDLGLTFWFEGTTLDEVCVFKPLALKKGQLVID